MPSAPPIIAFLNDVGGGEMLMIGAIALMLFGGKRLPDLARGLGKAIREFKKATAGVEGEIKRAMEEPPPSPPRRRITVPAPAPTTLTLPPPAAAPETPAPSSAPMRSSDTLPDTDHLP